MPWKKPCGPISSKMCLMVPNGQIAINNKSPQWASHRKLRSSFGVMEKAGMISFPFRQLNRRSFNIENYDWILTHFFPC